ncbi:hypothetical protein [Prescottella equi]
MTTPTARARKATTSTDSDWPTLTGRQEPHHLSVFDGDIETGEKAVELARRIGSKPMPWQREALHALMTRNDDGTWTHPDACIICPRQNGKSLILTLRILYGLFKLGETIIFTAQRWTTAEDIYLRTWALIEPRKSLLARVKKTTCSQGRGVIEMKNGNKVVFTTRSPDAGRGLTKLDLVIYDEAYNLTDGEMSALGPAQLAAEDPQTIYTSSAVNQEEHSNGLVLSALRERGLEGERELYFAEYMAPDGMDREDEATWQYANPSYGVIQTAKKIRKLMRGFATQAGRKSFDVEILGRGDWPVEELAEDVKPVVDLDTWNGLYDETPMFTGVTCLSVDMSTEREIRDRTCSIQVAAKTMKGAHLQLGYHGSADTTTVVKFLVAAVDAGDPVAVVIDPKSAAQVLIQPLQRAGVEPELMRAQDVMASTAGFLAAVDESRLTHDNDERMVEALGVAKLREIGDGGGVAWARRTSGTICQLVAGSNALWGLSQFEPKATPPPPSVAYEPSPAGESVMGDLMEVSW